MNHDSWQREARALAQRAYDSTYADAIADGHDESEALELAQCAADDVYDEFGEYDYRGL